MKKVVAVVFSLMLILSLVACSGTPAPSESTTTEKSVAPEATETAAATEEAAAATGTDERGSLEAQEKLNAEAEMLTFEQINEKLSDLDSAGVGTGEGITIGFLPSTMVNPFYTAMMEGVNTAMEKYPDAKLVTFDPSNEIAKQLSQLEDMVAMGCKAICIVPIDTQGMRSSFEFCHQNGVYVVDVDSTIVESDFDTVDALICSDNLQLGYLSGEDIVDRLPEGGNIAIMHAKQYEGCIVTVNGFWQAIKDKAKDPSVYVQVAEGDGQGATETSYSQAVDILQAHPDIDAWYCINDPSALGVLSAVKEAGKADEMLIYGKDGSPDYKKLMGTDGLCQSSAQSPIGMGKMCVEYAMQLIGGKTVNFLTYISAISITQENVDQYGRDSFM